MAKRGPKPIVLDNRKVLEALKNCGNFTVARMYYPFLDNIVTGVSKLFMKGSTRPLRLEILFKVVKNLPEISVSEVEKLTGYSKSHSQKLAASCRVISRACAKELDRWPTPDIELLFPDVPISNLAQAAIDEALYLAWFYSSKHYVPSLADRQEDTGELKLVELEYALVP